MSNPQTETTEPSAVFASLYPRLRLVKEREDFAEITVDGAAADLIEAGLLTREMLAALPRCGRKDFYAFEENRDCSSKVSRVKAGIRINLWGYGGPMATLREKLGIKAKPSAEAEPQIPMAGCLFPATEHEWRRIALDDIDDHMRYVEKSRLLRGIARYVGPRFRMAAEDIIKVECVVRRFRAELVAAVQKAAIVDTEAPARPSHLRLVVDNEARP